MLSASNQRAGVEGPGEDKPGKEAEAGDAAASSIQADAARRSRNHPEVLQISVGCSNPPGGAHSKSAVPMRSKVAPSSTATV
jgi:hypothetical protein